MRRFRSGKAAAVEGAHWICLNANGFALETFGVAPEDKKSSNCPPKVAQKSPSPKVPQKSPCWTRLGPYYPGLNPFLRMDTNCTRTHTARSTRRSRSPHDLAALCSVLSPRRVGRIRPHSDGNRAAPKGHGSRSPDLAAAARQVSAARPMPAYVQSSDRAPRPGWARDAHRKKPSRTDGERSGASRSLSDRAARRRTCADACTSGSNPAPRLAAIRPS